MYSFLHSCISCPATGKGQCMQMIHSEATSLLAAMCSFDATASTEPTQGVAQVR